MNIFTKIRFIFALTAFLFIFTFNSQNIMADVPSSQTLRMGTVYESGQHQPYFYGFFDAAGYSDKIYWGLSSVHGNHSFHEVLSGEWAEEVCTFQMPKRSPDNI
jgi:hypothetical protein